MTKSAARPVSRQEAKVATREALIDAGMAAFGAEGLDASLDGICARAGYTRGAFYVHFRDRDDFLVAIMDRVGEEFLAALFAPAEPLKSEPPSLTAIVVRFLEAIRSGAYPLTHKGGVRPHQLLQACARSPVVRARRFARTMTVAIPTAMITMIGMATATDDSYISKKRGDSRR